MRNAKGQSTLEMTFILPLLIMLAGAMVFFVYAGWQDLKVQQAANLAARMEGQEKVSGGTGIEAINQANGFNNSEGNDVVNPDVNDKTVGVSPNTSVSPLSGVPLFDRMKTVVRGLFSPGERVQLAFPRTGQNVDQINVYRTLNTPHIPFFSGKDGMPSKIVLKGTSYGGEDPFMYALPRWGKTSENNDNTPEWYRLMKDAREKHD